MRAISATLLTFYFINILTKQQENYYDILSVKRNAKSSEITKAYRKLSLANHPDHGGNKEKFIKINKAYKTLIDEDLRRVYDNHGEERVEEYEKNNPNRKQKGNIYSDFSSETLQMREEDTTVEVLATLEQLFTGHTFLFKTYLNTLCPKCFGSGSDSEKDIHNCPKCKGAGTVSAYFQYGPGFVVRSEQKCDKCSGKGVIVGKKCNVCSGRKMVSHSQIVEVDVDPGMKDGDTITLESKGDESVNKKTGHLVFKVATLPHGRFIRKENDLHVEVTISLSQALLGFDFDFESLTGEKVRLIRKEITTHGMVEKVVNKGMKIKSSERRGDLVVKYIVQFPKTLSEDKKAELEKINL